MSDFDIAVRRLTAWLRDYGPTKNKPFVDDVTIVLLTAKESPRLQSRIDEMRDQLAEKDDAIRSLKDEIIVLHVEMGDEIERAKECGFEAGKRGGWY